MDMIREKFWLCLFFVFTVFIQLKSYCAVVEGGDTISLGASITGNQTIISKNGTFELGFFSPNGTNNWYIGIWYAHLTEKTFIWVANRENPARNRSGVLRLSKEGDLELFNAEGVSLWSANISNKASRAVILDSVIAKSEEIQHYALSHEDRWDVFWSRPRDQRDIYGFCGAYGRCSSNNLQFCSCVEGFTPTDTRSWDSQESWSSGCVRLSPLNCDAKNGSTDRFLEPSVTLPDADSVSSYPATTKKHCQEACLLNCSCAAFTFNLPSGPCKIWSGD
ncbi:hypothetical protein SUGI_0662730 [Cryptomeria japonica]|nr:hypothetical protein SUGI_0662730 [Cryptomeria japonica]